MLLSELPIGAKVKDAETIYYGKPIIFQVAAKNHPGYPSSSVTLLTERIITLKAFDAREPGNANGDRRVDGNNRYLHSNIRQWLNKENLVWYTAQHEADQTPNTAGVSINPYDNEKGFLSNLSQSLKNRILTTSLSVARNIITDGGGSETVQDNIFLLSNTEVGLANENNTVEGSRLALFTTADSSRLVNPTAEAVENSSYTNASLDASKPWHWWLRTPQVAFSHYSRYVNPSGALRGAGVFNGYFGVRPAMNLPSDVQVSDSPDSDGAYVLQWWTPPSLSPKINGQYRNYGDGWVKVSGTWRKIDEIHTKINGVWLKS